MSKQADEPKRRPGRPTLYQSAFVKQAGKLVKLGATDYEIAQFLEIHLSTLYRWKHLHEEFCEALNADAKAAADDRVHRSLYDRAVGYTYTAEKIFQHQGELIRTTVAEHVPPDPGAAMNWLKNRRPDQWRDKKELSGNLHVALGELLDDIDGSGHGLPDDE